MEGVHTIESMQEVDIVLQIAYFYKHSTFASEVRAMSNLHLFLLQIASVSKKRGHVGSRQDAIRSKSASTRS